MFGYLCLRKKKICLWKHLEESWEPIEHCVSFKLRCISMFDTLMLCWTTSASSSHFLASIFLWIWKCRTCFLEWKMSGYTQTDLVSDTAISIGWGCKKTNLLQNPCWPCSRAVGWVDGSFGLIEWLPLNWWQNPVIKWEPISESLSTLQFGGCARIWEPCKCSGWSS